jgi:hypothetical protein
MKLKEVFGFKSSSSTLDEAVDMAVGDRTDSFSPMKQNMPAIKSRLSNTQVSAAPRCLASVTNVAQPQRLCSCKGGVIIYVSLRLLQHGLL